MENFKEKFDSIIIEKLSVDKSEIIPGAYFNADLGADSLDMVELVMEFEREFTISVPDDDADKIRTVADAENYIMNIVKQKEN